MSEKFEMLVDFLIQRNLILEIDKKWYLTFKILEIIAN